MRSSFARAVDNLAIALITIVAVFATARQFLRNNLLCLIISVAVAAVVVYCVIAVSNKKLDRLMIEKAELKQVEAANFALRKMDKKARHELFFNMLKELSPEQRGEFIIADGVALLDRIDREQIDKSDIFFASSQGGSVVILCNQATPDAAKLAADMRVHLFYPIETFALLKKFSSIPEQEPSEKKARSHLFSTAFLRRRAKDFIRVGLLLYFMALFVPFSRYYIIVASICSALGLACLIFGKKEVAARSLPLLD